jgi:hypothetical protein
MKTINKIYPCKLSIYYDESFMNDHHSALAGVMDA